MIRAIKVAFVAAFSVTLVPLIALIALTAGGCTRPLTHDEVIERGQTACGKVVQISAPNERTGAIDFVCADGRVVTINPEEAP